MDPLNRFGGSEALFRVIPTKECAPCCVAAKDDHGRLPIGFCGPSCVRRMKRREVWEYLRTVQNPVKVRYTTIWMDGTESGWEWDPAEDRWTDPTGDAAVGLVSD